MVEYIGDDTMRGRLNQITSHVEAIRHTLRDVAAGPRAVIGSDDVRVDQVDPLLNGKRVLIADDELNIRQTIGDVLGKHGCICTVCKDGYEAVSYLEQEEFDLVISDIRMPHRTGYDIFAFGWTSIFTPSPKAMESAVMLRRRGDPTFAMTLRRIHVMCLVLSMA